MFVLHLARGTLETQFLSVPPVPPVLLALTAPHTHTARHNLSSFFLQEASPGRSRPRECIAVNSILCMSDAS